MRSRGILTIRLFAVGVLVTLLAAPAFGAGFGIFEHGSKAMGMAGAFTAQADDGSAMFHNPAGLAFQREPAWMLGVTLIKPSADFTGAGPFPGPGVTEEGDSGLLFFPPHLYWVKPIGSNSTFGLGINSPFGLTTEWEDPDNFTGRYLSTLAELRVVDINPTYAWQATPNFSVGVGAILRFSDVVLERRVPFVNPFTNQVQDIAATRLEADISEGYGFTAGILHRVNPSFSWGLSYRSKVEVDYEGDGRFTQISTGNPTLDAVVAGSLPFSQDLPIETTVEFPDQASLGLAFALAPNLLLETDVNWTGWSSFEEIDIRFTENPEFDQLIPEKYEDVYNYRVGLRWDTSSTGQWRFGYVYDETPQPEGSVSPLLPDNDRDGYTIGYGFQGGSTSFDVAFMYLDFGSRTRDESFPEDDDPYFGTWETEAYLLGLSLGF